MRVFIAASLATVARAEDAAPPTPDLRELSIEDLANVEVTSVLKKPQSVAEAPAALFVITNDDVRRAGKISLPEALRLAPNLQVAQQGTGSYGISARGFNQSTGTANKLQVMIDGRVAYTSLYSGVFWDVQDVLLEDLERIEVISGPAATVWGSNAVNGLINVITRDASKTQGVLARVTGGIDRQAALRFGGLAGESAAYRVYVMGSEYGPSHRVSDGSGGDGRDMLQGGFRYDWHGATASVSVSGDAYRAHGQTVRGSRAQPSSDGNNLIGRWLRTFADGSVLEAQAYYDQTGRVVATGIKDRRRVYDLAAQYRFRLGDRHDVVAGVDYRVSRDRFTGAPRTSFLDPASRSLTLASGFIQDDIALSEAVHVFLGARLEHNEYTGWEAMPVARIRWAISERAMLWAAVSGAVRTPSRFDTDLINPGLIAGGPNFRSEKLTAYQVGYRGTPLAGAALSISAFYNVYHDLRTAEATTAVIFPLEVRNGMEGETYGLEAWGSYAVADRWRLSAGGSLLHKDLRLKPGARDPFGVGFAGNDPEHQLFLKSQIDLGDRVELDIDARHVGRLDGPVVPDYLELNARLGWSITDQVELSVAGFNLLEDEHVEFINGSIPARAIRRSVEVSARWRF